MNRGAHLFFDLGGTLVDLRGLIPAMEHELSIRYPKLVGEANRVAVTWFKETAKSTAKARGSAFRSGVVLTVEALVGAIAKAGVELDHDSAVDCVHGACKGYLRRAKLYPDAGRASLRSLRSKVSSMGIVTDSDYSLIRPLIKRLRLSDIFDVVIVSESMRTYKPDPRIYRAALEAAKAVADRSVFISDSVIDLEGAASVGMGTVWIRRGESADVRPPMKTVVLRDLHRLVDIVSALSRDLRPRTT